MSTKSSNLFARAARVFDGWTDADTGLRVLRLFARNLPRAAGLWNTPYHQCPCFLDGGQRVLLHSGRPLVAAGLPASHLLDLTTGEAGAPWREGERVHQVSPQGTALLSQLERGEPRFYIRDLNSDWESPSILPPKGWRNDGRSLLADGRRAALSYHRSSSGNETLLQRYDSPCAGQLWLLDGDGSRPLHEASGFLLNHVVASPADANLFAYDAWPAPRWDVEQVIRVRAVDGSFDQYAALDNAALRPADFWGVRDHFLWTPDGRRIVSYFNRAKLDIHAPFNHFEFDWWLSALDWRSGADLAAPYPPGRWGGHMGVSPDSRYILCAGGPGYDKLFVVHIEGLRWGWNERVLCSYPATVSTGTNADPFPHPFALPDQSGVIFTAGWPGDAQGVFLVEWPADL